MTTVSQPTNPTPPPGGEPDQWIGGQRDVYALIGSVPVTNDLLMNPAVTVLAEQRADGTLGCIDVLVDVVAQHNGLCASQARELASLLSQGADLADQWSGTNTELTPTELLANAFSSLRAAHALLRLIPGNADSYVKAAMDSISDAAGGAAMTNLDAQLPAGVEATDVDPWEPAGVDYPEYRMFWSKSLHAKLWVRVVGVQYADGSVAATGSDAPLVYIEHNEFTPRAVRDLAAALLAAADLAEEWAGSSRCITAPEDVSAAAHVDDEQASVVVNLPAPECYLHPDAATELGYQMVDAARQADRAAGVKR